MTRLLRVELIRFLSRRAILVLLALALVIPALFGVARVIDTSPPPADELAQAQERADNQAQRKVYQRQLAQCLEDPGSMIGEPLPDDVEATCEEFYLPQTNWFIDYQPLDLVDERESGSGFGVAVILGILMMLAGATFAGHDWASGSVSNQLLFEPRRPRVWAAKSIVVTAVTGLFALAVTTAHWLILGAVASSRDLHVADGVLLDCLQSGWRGAGVAAAAALGGYALTMLFRSTVAALGVLLAVSIAGGIVLAVLGISAVWNPGLGVQAIILDGARYWTDGTCPDGSAGCGVEKVLHLQRALVYLSSGLAAILAISVASFHRRDVP